MFHNLNLQFHTVADFIAWLTNQQRPSWSPIGSTYHNTFIPNAAQWRGHDSMASMQSTYAAKGWDRGPHCYLALGTSADGIFVMTPPWLPGIHSPSCNGSTTKPGRFGIEVVGDFATSPMSAGQLQLLTDVAAALHRYAGIGADINAHRDCDKRTCPGDAAYAQKPAIQLLLDQKMPPPPASSSYSEDSPILGMTTTMPGQVYAALADRFPVRSNDPNLYTKADVRDILDDYWRQCVPVGVNPLLAVSQTIHETNTLTSFWSLRPQRNPAGIGANGMSSQITPPNPDGWAYNTQRQRWEMGVSFRNWKQHSIPAHIGRLLAFVLPPKSGTPAQRELIERALSYRVLPSTVRGSAQTLKQLGRVHNPSGIGWASPGLDYGQRIAAIANQYLEAQ